MKVSLILPPLYPEYLKHLRWICIYLLLPVLPAQVALDPSEFSTRTGLYFPRSQVTFSSDVKLVEVAVVVRDGKGKTVPGLTKADFEIRDSGKKRDVSSFVIQNRVPAAAQTPTSPDQPPSVTATPLVRPRFIAIVIDDLNSAFPEFRRSQIAASKFVREGLSIGDRVGIFSTYGQQLLPFTSNIEQIAATIDKMRTRGRSFGSNGCPSISPYEAYLIDNGLDPTVLEVKAAETRHCLNIPPAGRGGRGGPPPQDTAVMTVLATAKGIWSEVRMNSIVTLDSLRGIVDVMTPLEGTKMILLASGGFISDRFDMSPMERVIQRALKAGVIINTLDAKGLYTIQIEMPPGGDTQSMIQQQRTVSASMQAGNDALGILADSTGGRFIRNSNDLEGGFRILGTLPETTYLLGFQPGDDPDGRYHKLEVRLTGNRKDKVQSRPGYVAEKEKPVTPQNRKVDNELLGFSSIMELPVRLTTSIVRKPNTPPALQVILRLDIAKSGFQEKNGKHTQQIELILALINDRNEYVYGKECTLNFALKPESYAMLVRNGMAIQIDLDPIPGEYRLRAVLQETNQNQFTAINHLVDIK